MKVLQALKDSGLVGSIYLRDASVSTRADLRRKGLQILEQPADMASAVSQSALLIHHGGVGTCEVGLAIGRPQLIIPRHQEQAMNALCLRRIKVAVATVTGGRFEVEHIKAALQQVRKQQYCLAASEQAEKIVKGDRKHGLAAVMGACEALLTG
jgi:UDP:flavonoid glycosyltransferase YjiC (YdhE family)